MTLHFVLYYQWEVTVSKQQLHKPLPLQSKKTPETQSLKNKTFISFKKKKIKKERQ